MLMDGSDGLLFQKIGRRLTMQRGLVSGSLHPPRIAAMGCLPAWSLDLCSAHYTPLAICSDGLPSSVEFGPLSGSLQPPCDLRRGTRLFPTYPAEEGSFGHSIFWHHLCGIIKKILLCSGVLLLMDGSDGLLSQKIGRRLTMQRGLVSGSLHPPRNLRRWVAFQRGVWTFVRLTTPPSRFVAMGCLPAWSLNLCSAQYIPLAICGDGLPSSEAAPAATGPAAAGPAAAGPAAAGPAVAGQAGGGVCSGGLGGFCGWNGDSGGSVDGGGDRGGGGGRGAFGSEERTFRRGPCWCWSWRSLASY